MSNDVYKISDSIVKQNEKKDEQLKEQISFAKCLIHETKKAYWYYIVGVITLIIGVEVSLYISQFLQDFGPIVGRFLVAQILNLIGIVFSINLLVYVIALILILPLDYSVIVCCIRRLSKEDEDNLVVLFVCGGYLTIAFIIIFAILFCAISSNY